jgi:hypothetical protein
MRVELDFPIDADKLEAMNQKLDGYLSPKNDELLTAIDTDNTTA